MQGTTQLFSGEATGLIVRLPGWEYPAVIDTLTTSAIDGYEALEASASARLQLTGGPRTHVHPVPLAAFAVSPEGKASVTVTVPLVGDKPALLTVRV